LSGAWPWLAAAGLGVYHGINPAMGWLFAVALGLHRGSRRVVWAALVPIAVGHALSVALVLLLVLALGEVVATGWLGRVGGLALLLWAAWHWRYGRRTHPRIGMRAGALALGLWSFVMASAHGAGLMLLPVVLSAPVDHGSGHHHHAAATDGTGFALGLLAVHTTAMLVATALVALLVYEWLGVGVLRRGWINLDLLWTAALVLTGVLLLAH
jgi:hypothetical protein